MAANPYIAQAKIDTGIDPATPFAQLTWDEQQRYQQRLAQLTLTHSSELSGDQVATARAVMDRGPQPAPVAFSVGDAVSTFGDEFLNQAEKINPLSEQNRGKLANYLMVLGALASVVALFLFLPRKKA